MEDSYGMSRSTVSRIYERVLLRQQLSQVTGFQHATLFDTKTLYASSSSPWMPVAPASFDLAMPREMDYERDRFETSTAIMAERAPRGSRAKARGGRELPARGEST